ncbi:MAG: chalcone isomerase family protein [Ramlibacter sp.]
MLAGAAAHAQPAALAAAQLTGSARLSVFGFQVYDARLWTAEGFVRDNYAAHAFALELAYLRDFDGADIARRSLKEMQGVEAFSAEQGRRWLAEMTRLFPNVKKGDRLTGIYRPGAGVAFLYNDKPAGEVRDPDFARVFMGIWLSPRTSEPAMREQLLAGATQ